MGLKEDIQSGVAGAFKALDNLKITCVFNSVSSIYDVTTGTVTKSNVSTTVHAIRSDFSKSEKMKTYNPNLKFGDFKLMVQSSSIPSPNLVDSINIGDKKYTIIGIEIDPADAVYEFHVRSVV